MIRSITSLGCSVALAVGAAGFLGCEEQGVDESMYGTEMEVREGLDTQAPALDGTGVGLETQPMHGPGVAGSDSTPDTAERQPAQRPGAMPPQDMNREPNVPSVPHPPTGDMIDLPAPGIPGTHPSIPTTPDQDGI